MSVYDYSECDEIAYEMRVRENPPHFASFHEAAAWVRERMPEATEQVKDNIADGVFARQLGGER